MPKCIQTGAVATGAQCRGTIGTVVNPPLRQDAANSVAAGRGGGVGGHAPPGGTGQGTAFEWAKIWNSEIWPLPANWRVCIENRFGGNLHYVITPPT